MKEYVEDKLMEFLQSRLEPFSVSGLLEFLGGPVSPADIEELSGFLVFNQLAYQNPGFDGEEELWITRAGLFTGKPLVIQPGKTEIASGILIPGSRFVPFYNPSLLPHELTFTFQGKPLQRVSLECTPDEIYAQYQMFGDEYVSQYLSLDNEENTALFSESEYDDPTDISISVVDMRDVYWGSQFKSGDRLIARLTDWEAGSFELAVLPLENIEQDKQTAWLKDLEENLVHSFEIAGPGASIDEQLAFAYFLGMDTLFTPHAGIIGDFLRWSDRVGVEPYGVETRLWFSGQTIPSQGSWMMTLIAAPSSMTEEAFMHLGLPLSANVMDSYVMDTLFRKETGIRDLVARMIPSRLNNSPFCLPVIERALQHRYKQLSADYNWFADHETGTLRTRCVALHNALMRFILLLQQSGIDPDSVPEQGAVILGQLMSHTVASLENIDFSGPDDPTDIDALWISIEGMEDSFFDIKTAIQEVLPELNKKRFSVIKKEKPDE